jgi:hypothetical protein
LEGAFLIGFNLYIEIKHWLSPPATACNLVNHEVYMALSSPHLASDSVLCQSRVPDFHVRRRKAFGLMPCLASTEPAASHSRGPGEASGTCESPNFVRQQSDVFNWRSCLCLTPRSLDCIYFNAPWFCSNKQTQAENVTKESAHLGGKVYRLKSGQ